MRIKNLNDRSSVKLSPPKPDITVWKGGKKQEKRIGKNLDSQLRIECDGYARKVIFRTYDNAKKQGDSLLVDSLNIVPAYKDVEKALSSQMVAFKGNKIQSLCNRETIFTEFVDAPDRMGHIYRQPTLSNKPCPVAGTNHKCPNNCVLNGDFYFYINELLVAGSSQLCRLRTHSIADNIAIASRLDEIEDSIGCIKTSPFVCEETRGYVVYRLSRKEKPLSRPVIQNKKRTGNRFISPDWGLHLELHPLWKMKYDAWLQMQELEKRRLSPSRKLITSVYGDDVIDVSARAIPLLEEDAGRNSLPSFVMDESKVEELRQMWQENNWTPEGLKELLQSRFGIYSMQDLLAIDEEGFEELKIALKKYTPEKGKVN